MLNRGSGWILAVVFLLSSIAAWTELLSISAAILSGGIDDNGGVSDTV